jgi:hypothetical protein
MSNIVKVSNQPNSVHALWKPDTFLPLAIDWNTETPVKFEKPFSSSVLDAEVPQYWLGWRP